MRAAARTGRMLLAAALLAAGSGCVAVNVGEPKIYTKTKTRSELSRIRRPWQWKAHRGS